MIWYIIAGIGGMIVGSVAVYLYMVITFSKTFMR